MVQEKGDNCRRQERLGARVQLKRWPLRGAGTFHLLKEEESGH